MVKRDECILSIDKDRRRGVVVKTSGLHHDDAVSNFGPGMDIFCCCNILSAVMHI